MNRYIYHYCALYQKSPMETVYIDGIALMEKRIVTQDDYKVLKKGIDSDNNERITLLNLALLGREQEG